MYASTSICKFFRRLTTGHHWSVTSCDELWGWYASSKCTLDQPNPTQSQGSNHKADHFQSDSRRDISWKDPLSSHHWYLENYKVFVGTNCQSNQISRQGSTSMWGILGNMCSNEILVCSICAQMCSICAQMCSKCAQYVLNVLNMCSICAQYVLKCAQYVFNMCSSEILHLWRGFDFVLWDLCTLPSPFTDIQPNHLSANITFSASKLSSDWNENIKSFWERFDGLSALIFQFWHIIYMDIWPYGRF